MKSKQYRTMIEDEKEYVFDSEKFHTKVREKANALKCSNRKIMEKISEKARLSYEAVRNWDAGHNGPGDLEVVKDIASVLECDFHELLDSIEREEEQKIMNNECVACNRINKGDEKKTEVLDGIFARCVESLYKLRDKEDWQKDIDDMHLYIDAESYYLVRVKWFWNNKSDKTL